MSENMFWAMVGFVFDCLVSSKDSFLITLFTLFIIVCIYKSDFKHRTIGHLPHADTY